MNSFRDVLNNVANKSGAAVRPTPLVEAAPTPQQVVESGKLFGGPSLSQVVDSMGVGGDGHVAQNHHIEVNKRLQALQDHIAATHAYLKTIGSLNPTHGDHLEDVAHHLNLASVHTSGAVTCLSRANKSI